MDRWSCWRQFLLEISVERKLVNEEAWHLHAVRGAAPEKKHGQQVAMRTSVSFQFATEARA